MKSRDGKSQTKEKDRIAKGRREKEKQSREIRYRCPNCSETRKHCGFPMICGPGWSKNRFVEAPIEVRH